MKKLITLFSPLLVFVAALIVSAPLMAEEEKDTEAKPAERACFWISQVRDFRAIDKKHVYLRGTGKKEHFLATLFSSCHDIQFAETIALSNRPSTRVCSNSNSRIQVIDHTSFPQSCLISNIERVENYKGAKALVEKRKEEKKKQKEEENLSSNEAENTLAMR